MACYKHKWIWEILLCDKTTNCTGDINWHYVSEVKIWNRMMSDNNGVYDSVRRRRKKYKDIRMNFKMNH